MIKHLDFPDSSQGQLQLRRLIKTGEIVLAGNVGLRIYGKLHCCSGKRMLRKNRVFFHSAADAIENGFRPCGHCMKIEWAEWKRQNGMEHDGQRTTKDK